MGFNSTVAGWEAGRLGGGPWGLSNRSRSNTVLKARGNWGGGHLNKNFIFLLLLKILHSESSILENTE